MTGNTTEVYGKDAFTEALYVDDFTNAEYRVWMSGLRKNSACQWYLMNEPKVEVKEAGEKRNSLKEENNIKEDNCFKKKGVIKRNIQPRSVFL